MMINAEKEKELLDMIDEPYMDLFDGYWRSVYYFNTEDPGFCDVVIKKLEEAGYDGARQQYDDYVMKQTEKNHGNDITAGAISPDKKVVAVCDNGGSRPLKEHILLDAISAEELDNMLLDPITFIVEGMITNGLTLLASPPKFGKSWLGMDLGVSVSTGSDFLGEKVKKCGVLYLALEDSRNRLQMRLRRVLAGREAPPNFFIATRSDCLGNGLIDDLGVFLQEYPDIGLIIIDTFQKIRSGGGHAENMYAVDYREVGQLKRFADENRIAVLLIHHTRKMKDPSDPFANISGTTGISGAADTMMVLDKEERTSNTAKLSIAGRDVEMQEYEVEFRKDCRWHILGTTDEMEEQRAREEYDQDPVVLTIKKLLDQNGGVWTGSASELINSSRYFGSPIHSTALALGKSISKTAEVMYQYDRIVYQAIKNGNAAKKHRFQYQGDIIFPETKSACNNVPTVDAVDSLDNR